MPNETNYKILIAEDDKLIMNALKAGLEAPGLEIISAYNGNEALEKIKLEKPDILLLDLVMPKLDGFEVLKKIRADKDTVNLHVLIFSNLDDSDSIEKAKQYNIDDYLLKANENITSIIAKIKNSYSKFNNIQFHYHI